jgi:hypothetical protein
MATFKKVGSGGLWKQKGQDGSSYYSGKIKIDLAEINDVQELTLFFSLSKSEKRMYTSPDLWLTAKVKEEEGGGGQGQLAGTPPPQEDDDIPF